LTSCKAQVMDQEDLSNFFKKIKNNIVLIKKNQQVECYV
jgi:hypothetical protein